MALSNAGLGGLPHPGSLLSQPAALKKRRKGPKIGARKSHRTLLQTYIKIFYEEKLEERVMVRTATEGSKKRLAITNEIARELWLTEPEDVKTAVNERMQELRALDAIINQQGDAADIDGLALAECVALHVHQHQTYIKPFIFLL